ncbi:MAG: 4-alpha-glucanotransferase [Gammaproteobacteria bacterium]|nr:4-alpha-glucanotransferase [Gammaproteobacteria bacterium]
MKESGPIPLLTRRRAGVLLHPTSLPGSYACGDIGHEAYRFIEFIAAAGFSLWQMLPLGPTHSDHSPYLCLSANACNPDLISLDWLRDHGYIATLNADREAGEGLRQRKLAEAFASFTSNAHAWHAAFDDFLRAEAEWLDDYALFMVIRAHHDEMPWYRWEAPLRNRESGALARYRQRYPEEIKFQQFCQFIFQQQWRELRAYAQRHGVYLFGDLPIYLSLDSADTWVNREIFLLDAEAAPRYVAGVPPDFFAAQGQRWGNPIYNWHYLEQTGFAWWQQRVKRQLELFDLLRIDHFRGLQAYWRIPAEAATAVEGEWIEAPGDALLHSLQTKLGSLPFVAEDLGMITAEVDALRSKYRLPGMKVLQFAFDGDPANIYLPHNHQHNAVVYSGTHDNDTSVGWYRQLDEGSRQRVRDYLQLNETTEITWPLLTATLASVANTAIIPLQDLLGLDSEARMNTPGTTAGNWGWRFSWQQIPYELAPRLRHLCRLYGRCD